MGIVEIGVTKTEVAEVGIFSSLVGLIELEK